MLALALAAPAHSNTLSAPQAVPLAQTVPDAADTPYPGGTMRLDIDATDVARGAMGADGPAFALTFAAEAGLFLLAALFAARICAASPAAGMKGDYRWSASTSSS